ncbi:DEAD/DEAH box helicase [Cavenderia fasciculata]|uniref:RNA helicase n=1 Tax=Cavenderia fasciculata TaxID=261658 RepID=F4PYM5_CACFS|nr:DEAD/DEAH box helicase [Cavenderia fasciculata]EGG19291.1 DEAD/DEAH box helicase [Cavenderia fasciculata]|eukprot:XP_004357562.1 DEAD/DEAH box helicase [Cavenderia fasciculata]
MSDAIARSKQYDYKANSNLVIHSERNPKDLREPKGEPETLWGRLHGKMGDRVNYSKPTELLEKVANLKRKTQEKGGSVDTATLKRVKGGPTDILEATDNQVYGGYRPSTKETKAVFERLVSFIQTYIGDQPSEIINGAADEIIATLKNDRLKAPEKKKDLDILLRGLTEDKFAELTRIITGITDFKEQRGAGAGDGQQQVDTLGDAHGVAVVIDEDEEDQDNLSDFEIRQGGGSDDEDNDDQDSDREQGVNMDATSIGGGGGRNNTDKSRRRHHSKRGEQGDVDGEINEDEKDNNNNNKEKKENTSDDEDEQQQMGKKNQQKETSALNPMDIDAFWIQRKISMFEEDAMQAQQLAERVLQILKQQDVRRCENDLVNLFDVSKFDFIKLLLNNRQTILYCTLLAKAENDQEKKKIEDEMSGNPILFMILNKIKGIDQQSKTVEKKQNAVVAKKQQDREKQKQQEEIKTPKKQLDLKELSFAQGSHLMTNKKFQFPAGSKRETYKGYEEIHVPARASPPFNPDERLVAISELPEWARTPFKGFEKLNRVQSRLYEYAFKSNDNLLLSAPTSAGKTNVAMLTILHEIGMHMKNGVLDRDAFKIVYIAPMKSLVQEMVQNFSNRLKDYGIVVKELTGDQGLTNKQISETQIIVTTPEKWDIITRKAGERAYTSLVRLVIIDEIHLLHDERGPVLECIVARTLRMVESTQEMVRLVGLSATLPNYEDVATFLRVKPEGIFYFDSSYRPIPLEQQYIGVSDRGFKQLQTMNDVTFKKVSERAGVNQMLVFVHSRRETGKTARDIRDRAVAGDLMGQLIKRADSREILRVEAEKTAKSAELKELLPYGIGIHHAGLSRSDRTLVEELFADQHLQVLVSTATLAWGVNLPAHTVIIKGTQVYNTERGWTELSPLDVTQMLGRAGRPPFDSEGEGIVITSASEMQFYLSLINTQLSIESQFISRLPDNLNAEIVSGSVASVKDAVHWLGYTYLFICMLRNPPLYDISYDDLAGDEELEQRRIDLVHAAATQLDKNNLIKYDRRTGRLQPTELGRVASHYYITSSSMAVYHEHLRPVMSDIDFFRLFSLSNEFSSVVVREGEKGELEKLLERVPIPVKESIDEPAAKINVLLQAYISNLKLEGFALIVDMFYVAQSAARIVRALYDIVLRKGWAQLARKIINVCRMVDRRMWISQSPLRQFPEISERIVNQLERRQIPIEDLYEYNSAQLGTAIQSPAEGKKLYKLIHHFPKLDLTAHVQPILHGLLRVDLTLTPDFEFDDKYHGNSIGWWIVVEDVDGERILYHEFFSLKRRMMEDGATVTFTVPLTTPMPPQYYVRVVADRWIGAEYSLAVSFKHLILPQKYPPCRGLLDLQPLSIDSLRDDRAASVFRPTFRYFNPVQTQVFSSLYTTDENVFVAAPANTGKTVCAELAVLRTLINNPEARCVYIAPVESMVTVRSRDWAYKFGQKFGKVSVLTGDAVTDNKILEASRIIVTTAERWDILSRKWRQKNSRVQSVSLFIVDELQMIGSGESGSTMEIVLSRMRYIATQTGSPIRFIGLSSPVANARDLAEWMGATPATMFNFHPDVRPVEMEIQMQGFDYPNFQERQMAMTKPALYAVSHMDRTAQTLVYVPTRKAARQMAADIILFVDSEDDMNTRRYLGIDQADLEPHLAKLESPALRDALVWGVAFYHDGLSAKDKRIVEALFKSGAIKVLVATHSECWALDVQAQLVIIMGTQTYNQGTGAGHTDYPINDILQMMARAGKQGTDQKGRCLLLCHSPKKEYYKTFLNEPLPVESHLDHFLADHFNAEIASRTISKKQDGLDYLTWSFMYRRLTQNPNYYNLTGTTHLHLAEHLSELVENTLLDLQQASCITIKEEEEVEDEDEQLQSTNLGMIASYYYLKYTTIELFANSLKAATKRKGILEILSTAPEFTSSLVVRHRENNSLQKMAAHLPLKIDRPDFDSVATKVNVLLQAHFSRKPISADLYVDQCMVLENATRLLQAIVDVISSSGWLQPALSAMELSQMCTQAVWNTDSYLKQLPHMTEERLANAKKAKIETVFELMSMEDDDRNKMLGMSQSELEDLAGVCMRFPDIDLTYQVENEEDLHADDKVTVHVAIERDIDDELINESINLVHAPYYPKERIGGWWVIVGDEKTNQLLSIKRLTLTKRAKLKLDFPSPPVGDHQLTIYLMSDSYTGCDQVYNIDINIKPALIDDEQEEENEQEDKMEE